MALLLLLTPAELTRDPRARRAAAAAASRGLTVVGICGRISGEEPVSLEGVEVVRAGRRGSPRTSAESGMARSEPAAIRELRGVFRLARLAVRSLALAAAARRLGAVDVVHANDVDTLPAGWLIARNRGARLVYDAHELYSEFEAEPPHVYRRAVRAVEGALARRADAVVTVNDELADELTRILGLRARPLVVLNAPQLSHDEPAATPAEGPLRAIYQGAFGHGRPLGDLLDALAGAPSVHLTIRVVRYPRAAIEQEIRSRGLGARAAVADPVGPGDLVASLRGYDVGIVFDRPQTRNSELSLPNKLFEYFMAGLAVVAPRFPSLGAVVDSEQVGMTFDPGSPPALGAALERLADDRALLARMRERARTLARERYNAEAQAEKLAQAWGVEGGVPRPGR